MSPQSATVLEKLFQSIGLAGAIDDGYPEKHDVIASVMKKLDDANAEYFRRVGIDGPFAPTALDAEAERNPHKIRAFFNALRVTESPEMLMMVWRILQGLSIRLMEINYKELDTFNLRVVLAKAGHDEIEEYRSQDIMDFRLVRSFGIVTDRPLFAGYSPGRERSRHAVSPTQ